MFGARRRLRHYDYLEFEEENHFDGVNCYIELNRAPITRHTMTVLGYREHVSESRSHSRSSLKVCVNAD
jgi:hypothetical protein